MFTIFLVLIVIVAFLLIVVIMVQNPKGGGLSSSFGGGGAQVGGAQNTTNFLDKSTWTLATVLLVLILLSNVAIMGNGEGSESRIIGGDNAAPATEVPAQETPAATTEDSE
ncbi:protein translocase subunit secG [Mesonia phycicola]|uniref:Protein-export membrane protein SecG n=1 Tax=Mesonia phycicola TaxID=579105 RepID=A0A1M6EXW6_9FLAO|nr:preprotein translocase subunit SecG [Mesonia phycicola]SHI90250.1 protein translocase subunit secG [Mesonia phycicola]